MPRRKYCSKKITIVSVILEYTITIFSLKNITSHISSREVRELTCSSHLIRELYNQRDAERKAVPTDLDVRLAIYSPFRKILRSRPLFPRAYVSAWPCRDMRTRPNSLRVRSRCRHVKEARFFLPDYHTRTLIRVNRGARLCAELFLRQVQGGLHVFHAPNKSYAQEPFC